MPSEPTHRVRSYIFAKDRTYRISSEALWWEEGGVEGQVQFSDIDQVRLISYAALGPDQHRCIVRDKTGKMVRISLHHFKRFGWFEDRSQSYAALVRELTQRVASANPQARFVAGSTRLWLLSIATLVVAGLTVLAIAFVFTMVGLGRVPLIEGLKLVVVFVVMAVILPGAWRGVRSGRARQFDPSELSFSVLGVAEKTASS